MSSSLLNLIWSSFIWVVNFYYFMLLIWFVLFIIHYSSGLMWCWNCWSISEATENWFTTILIIDLLFIILKQKCQKHSLLQLLHCKYFLFFEDSELNILYCCFDNNTITSDVLIMNWIWIHPPVVSACFNLYSCKDVKSLHHNSRVSDLQYRVLSTVWGSEPAADVKRDQWIYSQNQSVWVSHVTDSPV